MKGFFVLSIVRKPLLACVGVFLGVSAAAAQSTCDAVAQRALAAVNANCATQANNTVCYGNFHLQTTPAPGANATFSNPADRTPLETLQTIISLPFNAANQEWGVSVLRVQASGPGVLPGQAITLMLVGDATLTGVGAQAYQITPGLGLPNCGGVPPSSLLVQGPRGVSVDFTLNGANIRTGSSLVITAHAEDTLTFSTVDGRAFIDGVVVPVGYTTTAALDEDGQVEADSFSEPVVFTPEEAALFGTFEAFNESILEDPIEPLSEEALALLDALGYAFAAENDGHLLLDLLDFMLEAGYLPSDFEGASDEDIAAFFLSDEFAETTVGFFDDYALLMDGFLFDESALIAETLDPNFADLHALDPDVLDAFYAQFPNGEFVFDDDRYADVMADLYGFDIDDPALLEAYRSDPDAFDALFESAGGLPAGGDDGPTDDASGDTGDDGLTDDGSGDTSDGSNAGGSEAPPPADDGLTDDGSGDTGADGDAGGEAPPPADDGGGDTGGGEAGGEGG